MWGSMLDYYHYTGDASYNDAFIQAMTHSTNLGPDFNYMPKEHDWEEGNDDLFFWGSAAISAGERNFPQPDESIPTWLEIGANVFNQLASRWDTSACNGGLRWQILASNPNGLDYKNSVSNGGFFQIAARMARATGNDTYLDWAEKIWDWSAGIGFIDPQSYHVYDGASSNQNCSVINKASFTYTSGIYLHGAAVLANHTAKPIWTERTHNLLDGAGWFFSPFANSTDILYEAACEKGNTCNADMSTHKGYLARFMWQATTMVPSITEKVTQLMTATSKAAVKTCTGGKTGRACGMKWWVGGYDGNTGLGQEMCTLEAVQGFLAQDATAPLTAKNIKVVRAKDWGTSNVASSGIKGSSATPPPPQIMPEKHVIPVKRMSAATSVGMSASGVVVALALAMFSLM